MIKTILLFAALFTCSICARSQSWSIGVYQDVKLAVQEDDYGNEPFTLNVIGKAELFFKEDNYGKFMIYPQVEYADLAGGEYLRICAGGGYTLSEYNSRTNASISTNWGVIERFGHCYNSFEFQLDVNVKVLNNFRVGILLSETQRSDIGDIWRFNSYVGLKWSI